MICRFLFRRVAVIHDIPDEAEYAKKSNGLPSDIKLPPAMTVLGHSRICMVIVVPPLTVCNDRNEPVISAVIGCFVISISPHVGKTVYEPCCM